MSARWAIVAPVLAALALAGCGGEPERPHTLRLAVEPIALFPDNPEARELVRLHYRGGLSLRSDHADFGGVSGLDVSDDGSRLLAVTERGRWLTATLVYDEDGDLAGIGEMRVIPMLDAHGEPLNGGRANGVRVRGLAALSGGRAAVSFDGEPRLAVYEIGEDWSGLETAPARPLPAPPGSDRWSEQGGLRALAEADGALWVGVEYPAVAGQSHPVFRYDLDALDQEPSGHTLRLALGHGLTAMAGLSETELVVIERSWTRASGVSVRVSRAPISAIRSERGRIPGRVELLAELSGGARVDNFEGAGIAWIDERPRLLLISDNDQSEDDGDDHNNGATLLMSFDLPGTE